MMLLTVLLAIALLVLLITWGKCHPFIAFLIVAIAAAMLLGIPLPQIPKSIHKGIGDTMGSLVGVIVLGAMQGKLVAESGGAQAIASALMRIFGTRNIKWAMVITGFLVGIPLFYNVGFVLLIPLIFSVAYQYRLPAVYVGVPLLAALSVTHGFLPPHPSPAALVPQLNANMGLTLLYGIVVSIPAIIVAGPFYARFVKNIVSTPLQSFKPKEIPSEKLPGFGISVITALLPVILLAATTVLPLLYPASTQLAAISAFIGEPTIVMLISLAVATWFLGIGTGMGLPVIMNVYTEAVKDIVTLLLIIAGAGALKQVFTDSGVSKLIATQLSDLKMDPLLLGWLISATIRVCVGSATVAGLTTAGIIAPLALSSGVNPNLMVLSIGAGSLMFSHVNDSGFWMFKEYFNLSIRDTIRSWSIMETIVAIVGLIGVLALDAII